MSLLDQLSDRQVWESFYEYKTGLACPKDFTKKLRVFIDEERYVPVCAAIESGAEFPLPKRSVISKMSTGKKRVVYTYPEDENIVLKLLTYLLLRRCDGIFCDNLYSFRPRRTAQDAVRRIVRTKGLSELYSYKVDISDYFNSIPVDRLLPMLRRVTAEDERLYEFLASLLTEPRVLDRGEVCCPEQKGIMAGTPQASFYANLYLKDLDELFSEKGVLYARYSDDIILFARTEEDCAGHAETVRAFLSGRGLRVNPAKECFASPQEGFVFLGFFVREGVVDIAPATVKKLKAKMRRKRDALARWNKRNGMGGENAAKAFVRVFNRKLLESSADNELSWASWFFPTINTADSLRVIDRYAQDCIRYLVSGTHTKARYNVRYEDLKALGYRSLVHEYYGHQSPGAPVTSDT